MVLASKLFLINNTFLFTLLSLQHIYNFLEGSYQPIPKFLAFYCRQSIQLSIASANFKQVEFPSVGIEKLLSFKIPPRTQRSTRTEESLILESFEGSLHILDITIIGLFCNILHCGLMYSRGANIRCKIADVSYPRRYVPSIIYGCVDCSCVDCTFYIVTS